jgi:TolB-like protein
MRNSLHGARSALVCCFLSLAAVACGGGALRLDDITPQSVPTLEATRAARPGDVTATTRLGVGYFRANQLDAARALLDSASTQDPQNGIAAIFLGMTAESQGDFAAARTAYERYVAVARSSELRGTARQRLALLGRRELEHDARVALANESLLTSQPPDPNTIAVMPFAYTGTNAEVAPLSRGFAQLMVTDLARSRQLRVLERERMQAMVDEMHLSSEGRADPQSAARGGRLLRASRVVQGSLSDRGDQLAVSTAVVDVASAGVATAPTSSDQLARLFDLEKRLVLRIFDGLGIQLTDAERSSIDQRPTQNLQAFLAWSRGLEAEDRGDYAGARDLYQQAQRLDPTFSAAGQSAQQASDMSAASSQTVSDVDVQVTANAATETGAVTPDQQQQVLQATATSVNPTGVTQTETQVEQTTSTQPTDRDATSEATKTDTIKPTSGTVIITIRRP